MTDINYSEIINQTHVLIGGTTGSGKSVLINGIINTLLSEKCQLVLIDLKKVELIAYKDCQQTFCYSDNIHSAISALKTVIKLIESRYKLMQLSKEKKSESNHIYVIIDELADLMTVAKKDILPLLQRIGQIGRAANVHLICATQCPLVSVIPTSLKVNFTCIIGLKTRSKQDSRNILGISGCEELPMYGYGYVLIPSKEITLYSIPYINDNVITETVSKYKKSFVDRHALLVIAVCILLKVLVTVL